MVEESVFDSINNLTIFDSMIVTKSKLQNPMYRKIVCFISGGSDSDILLDLLFRTFPQNNIQYVFFDTGLEYQATKDHLKFLEKKYGIEVEIEKAKKPIPTCCRTYGQPFVSKQVSEFINRLQRHEFQWEDEDFETLYKKYPKCKAALKWWCNKWERKNGNEGESFGNAESEYRA